MSEWETEGQGGATEGLDDDEPSDDEDGGVGEVGTEGEESSGTDDEEFGGGM